ncbi:YybH family protein [Bauldia sp.]|uniref:YybH family protein n=1 Tax=Bauldia sp. TaxID=2575872 RepID=UPI003BA8E35B
MTILDDVRQASDTFYSALSQLLNGNATPMAGAWADDEEATAQHPIGGRDVGTPAVLESFGRVGAIAEGGNVGIEDQKVHVGSDMAIETGVEKGTVTMAGHTAAIDQRVTNVYRKEGDQWKLLHHHTDVSPGMQDILAKSG